MGNYTAKNVLLEKSGGKGKKTLSLSITFISPDGKNFGKTNPNVLVPPLTVNLTQNWQLDEDQQPQIVGAVLEPLDELQSKTEKIVVISGCKDPEACKCNMTFSNLKMDLDTDTYSVGSDLKLVFELELQNSGDESSIENSLEIMSSSKFPRPKSVEKLEDLKPDSSPESENSEGVKTKVNIANFRLRNHKRTLKKHSLSQFIQINYL